MNPLRIFIFIGVVVPCLTFSALMYAIPPSVKEDKAARPAITIDLSGYYDINGVGTEPYEALGRIDREGESDNYKVTTYLGSQVSRGIGMYGDNQFVVGWFNETVGITKFQVTQDTNGKPVLIGTWTALGAGKGRYKETFTFFRGVKK